MQILRFVAFVLMLFTYFAQAQSAPLSPVPWLGEYGWGEDGNAKDGGDSQYVYHKLTISRDDKGVVRARLGAQGFDTSFDLICTVQAGFDTKTGVDSLDILFLLNGEDNAQTHDFEMGDLLLSLERVRLKGSKIITRWYAYKPRFRDRPKQGQVRFMKISEK